MNKEDKIYQFTHREKKIKVYGIDNFDNYYFREF